MGRGPLKRGLLGEGYPRPDPQAQKSVNRFADGRRRVQHPLNQVGPDALNDRAQLVIGRRRTSDEGHVAAPVFVDEQQEGLDTGPELFGDRFLGIGFGDVQEELSGGLDQRHLIRPLRSEVVEEKGAGDAGPPGYLVQGELVERRGLQQLEADGHQLSLARLR